MSKEDLNEHAAHTIGGYMTDRYDLYALNEDLMWRIDDIDFDQEINFKQIS